METATTFLLLHFCCYILLFGVVVNKLTFILDVRKQKGTTNQKKKKNEIGLTKDAQRVCVPNSCFDNFFGRKFVCSAAQLLIYADRLLILIYGNALRIQITAIRNESQKKKVVTNKSHTSVLSAASFVRPRYLGQTEATK